MKNKRLTASTAKIFLILRLTLALGLNAGAQEPDIGRSRTGMPNIVYSGPAVGADADSLFSLGFSHVDVLSVRNPETIPVSRRYILWTGIAYALKSAPWAAQKSPFANDLDAYHTAWNKRLSAYTNRYTVSGSDQKVGILVLDIEAKLPQNHWRKADAQIASFARDSLSYRKTMAWLYLQPLEYLKKNFDHFRLLSSYGDVPVERVWWEIPDQTWEQWTSSPANLNYVTHQADRGRINETDFASALDFYSVSAYFFYDPRLHDNALAGRYLAYMLFMLEANQAWSDKDVYLYQTFRLQGTREKNRFISESMVRNMVVFSIMAGAKGLVLHDDFKRQPAPREFTGLLKIYAETLSEMQRYSRFFSGGEYFKPVNARDLFADRLPVVRGITMDGQLLLAVADPFLAPGKSRTVPVTYHDKTIRVTLTGPEPILRLVDLNE